MPRRDEKQQWKLVLAYDGTDFHGWQVQPGHRTIQGALGDALAAVTGERVLPQGSGRTDAGVHALGQVASFALSANIPPANLQRALNRLLPGSIRVLSAQRVPAGFHARHSAVRKVYQYGLFPGDLCPPFLARYALPYRWPLEFTAMQQAAAAIVGTHDFTSFAAADPERAARLGASDSDPAPPATGAGNLRHIEESCWSRIGLEEFFRRMQPGWIESPPDSNGPEREERRPASGPAVLLYTVRGNGFLHHMVRNLVGTFLEVGRGRLVPSSIGSILAARDRARAGPTAPAQGLCLVAVGYGGLELQPEPE